MPLYGAHDHQLVRFLLHRGLALVYFVAFLVAANQWRGLLGEDGLLPVPAFLERVEFSEAPSLFHWRYSDGLAEALAWCGAGLAAAAFLGLPSRLAGTAGSVGAWFVLWALYLSLVNVGQVFHGFGWESQLLETGFVAIFLGAAGTGTPDVTIWLFRWLIFRVMLGAGLIKMRGDRCWRELTCLHYHHETQPLPNPLSWFFHHLPGPVLRGGVAFTHAVQLVVPFAYFAPAPVRWFAGGATVLFQGTLILSGNLSFLNWLTIVAAVACFDDALLAGALPLESAAAAAVPLPLEIGAWAVAALVAVRSVPVIRNMISPRQRMNASFDPLRIVNTYGAFGSVTRERREIVLEGSRDGTEWRDYAFPAKPGDPGRMPPWVSPYHYRLDWQMWFAAMSSPRRHPWLLRLVAKLLEGDEQVTGLLRRNPFPEEPPSHVRARLYRYRFTEPAELRETGDWWRREELGEYLPAMSLRHPTVRQVLGRQRRSSSTSR